jgi:hypothetical protein
MAPPTHGQRPPGVEPALDFLFDDRRPVVRTGRRLRALGTRSNGQAELLVVTGKFVGPYTVTPSTPMAASNSVYAMRTIPPIVIDAEGGVARAHNVEFWKIVF